MTKTDKTVFKESTASIGNNAFIGCDGFSVPLMKTFSETFISYVFFQYFCKNLFE